MVTATGEPCLSMFLELGLVKWHDIFGADRRGPPLAGAFLNGDPAREARDCPRAVKGSRRLPF